MNIKFIAHIMILAVEAAIFVFFFVTLTSKAGMIKENKWKLLIFCLFYTAFGVWIVQYLPVGFHTLGMMVMTILLLSFITHTNLYYTTVSVVVSGLFIAIMDTIISFAYMALLNMDLRTLVQHPLYYPLFAFTSKVVQVALCAVLYKFNKSKLKIHIRDSHNGQYMFAALQMLLMALFIMSINYNAGVMDERYLYNSLLVFLYFLSLALSIFDIREREKMMKLVQKEKSLEEYINNLEDVVNIIRKEKHEFTNHLQTIYALCKLGKSNAVESIDNYLEKVISDVGMSYSFYETGNDYIDGLLAIKSHVCHQKNINLTVRCNACFTLADTDECDVAGIVGNIVNNAIECFDAMPENEEKKIEFLTYREEDTFYLILSNNGPEIPKQAMERLFEKGYTSKSDVSEHGFGLCLAKNLAVKNNGNITVGSRPGRTEFIVTFNCRDDVVEKVEDDDEVGGSYKQQR